MAKGYVASKKGRPMLVDQRDYVYVTNRLSKKTGRVFWRCSFGFKGCKARAVSEHDKITRLFQTHNHPAPQLEKFTQKFAK